MGGRGRGSRSDHLVRRLPETNWRRRSLPPLRSPNPPYVPLRPSSKRGSGYASSLPPPRYPSPSDPLREEKHGIQALCVRTRNPPSIHAPQTLLKKKSRPSSAPPCSQSNARSNPTVRSARILGNICCC